MPTRWGRVGVPWVLFSGAQLVRLAGAEEGERASDAEYNCVAVKHKGCLGCFNSLGMVRTGNSTDPFVRFCAPSDCSTCWLSLVGGCSVVFVAMLMLLYRSAIKPPLKMPATVLWVQVDDPGHLSTAIHVQKVFATGLLATVCTVCADVGIFALLDQRASLYWIPLSIATLGIVYRSIQIRNRNMLAVFWLVHLFAAVVWVVLMASYIGYAWLCKYLYNLDLVGEWSSCGNVPVISIGWRWPPYELDYVPAPQQTVQTVIGLCVLGFVPAVLAFSHGLYLWRHRFFSRPNSFPPSFISNQRRNLQAQPRWNTDAGMMGMGGTPRQNGTQVTPPQVGRSGDVSGGFLLSRGAAGSDEGFLAEPLISAEPELESTNILTLNTGGGSVHGGAA